MATAALLVLAGAGCAPQGGNEQTPATADDKPVTTEPIKVGWMGPLTGDVATVGVACKQAAEMAVKEINDAGGISGRKLEVIYEDSACDAKTGSNAGNKLINADKVVAIIGDLCSGPTLAVAPVAEQNKVLMLATGATAPSITTAGDYIFRIVPSDSYQGKLGAELVYNTLGKKKAAVLYAKADYTEGLANIFTEEYKKLGGEVVLSESFLQTARDLKTQLTKVKNSGAEVLYFPTYTEAGVAALKQAKDLGLKAQIVGPETFDDPKMQAADGANGVIYTMPASVSNYSFKTKYLSATGLKEMPVYVTQSYDAPYILANVLKQVGTDPEKIKSEMYNIKNYAGVSGTIGFDGDGDLSTAQYEIRVIKNNKGEKYATE